MGEAIDGSELAKRARVERRQHGGDLSFNTYDCTVFYVSTEHT